MNPESKKSLKELKLEILEDTVQFYSVDPEGRRSVNPDIPPGSQKGGRCMYLGPGGRMCAFARMVHQDHVSKLIEYESVGCKQVFKEIPNLKMKTPRLNADSWYYWARLQALHDWESYWDKKGLSVGGVQELNSFRADIESGEF